MVEGNGKLNGSDLVLMGGALPAPAKPEVGAGAVPASQLTVTKQVRIVPMIQVQEHPSQPLLMMFLGEREPEIGSAMMPDKARELAKALLMHADAMDRKKAPIIIVPGGALPPAPKV